MLARSVLSTSSFFCKDEETDDIVDSEVFLEAFSAVDFKICFGFFENVVPNISSSPASIAPPKMPAMTPNTSVKPSSSHAVMLIIPLLFFIKSFTAFLRPSPIFTSSPGSQPKKDSIRFLLGSRASIITLSCAIPSLAVLSIAINPIAAPFIIDPIILPLRLTSLLKFSLFRSTTFFCRPSENSCPAPANFIWPLFNALTCGSKSKTLPIKCEIISIVFTKPFLNASLLNIPCIICII